MDIKTTEERSRNMAAIKNRNTKPELLLRKALYKKGLRYRINSKIFGKPDIVFLRKRLAIFVDGCFWHCCPKCYKKPDVNSKFWENKIYGNVKRDREVTKKLTEEGWQVERFWEHEIYADLNSISERLFKMVVD